MLPAKQVIRCAPWVIEQSALESPPEGGDINGLEIPDQAFRMAASKPKPALRFRHVSGEGAGNAVARTAMLEPIRAG